MLYLLMTSAVFAQDTGESSSFDVIAPEDWGYADAAVGDMAQEWTDESGQVTWAAEEGHVITYGVVEDADEPGIFYFATKRDEGDGQSTLSLFRYNTSNYYFWRLQRIEDVVDATQYVVGYDGGYVVYAETSGSYDPGTCGEPIVSAVDGTGGALYMLPDNPDQSWSEGPTAYTAADEDVQVGRDRQAECEAGTAE